MFEYYVEYDQEFVSPPSLADALLNGLDINGTNNVSKKASKLHGRFIVDPKLMIPNKIVGKSHPQNVILPLDGIVLVTVMPKWLPILKNWLPYFKSFSDTGYNMIHFGPIQQRGTSNSPYSIYDQLCISNDLFETDLAEDIKIQMLKEKLDVIESEYRILSITDVVWNHTANNSHWLLDHPEAGYNLQNSPHLKPAFELDDALITFSEEISTVHGRSPILRNEHDVEEVVNIFQSHVLPKLRLWEYFVMDVSNQVNDLRTFLNANPSTWKSQSSSTNSPGYGLATLSQFDRAAKLTKEALYTVPEGGRFSKKLKVNIAADFMIRLCRQLKASYGGAEPSVDEVCREYEALLNEINLPLFRKYDEDVSAIIDNIKNRGKYLRVAEHGPKLGPLSRGNPLVDTYFTRLPMNKTTSTHHPDSLKLANNGWIWNADPMVDFAGPTSSAYFRREVIAWGDCVKLRYGQTEQDSPWLWSHMAKYTRLMAKLFHGFRIDNCHSTPIHVAEYLLDVARQERPDLYVMAELFTGSEEKDITFMSRLGINSLIREAMQAWDSFELSRLAHRHGGQPVGSFTLTPENFPISMLGHPSESPYKPLDTELVVEIKGSTPHALFMDCTHDNETPHQKRTAEDTLPNAAVVAMTSCAVGSVKGYDEIVPQLLDVVSERRKYRVPEWSEGILPAKEVLNNLHLKMSQDGYTEIHVHHENDYISIHRVHPVTHDGYLMIARTSFVKNNGNNQGGHTPITLRNTGVHLLCSARLSVHHNLTLDQRRKSAKATSTNYLDVSVDSDTLSASRDGEHLSHLPPSPNQLYHQVATREYSESTLGVITGLPCELEFSTTSTSLTRVDSYEEDENKNRMTVLSIDTDRFKHGSFVMYRTWVIGSGIPDEIALSQLSPTVPSSVVNSKGSFDKLWSLLGMNCDMRACGIDMMVKMGFNPLVQNSDWADYDTLNQTNPSLFEAVRELGVAELNVALYRSADEEMDTIGHGVYNIPDYSELPYCGLQGFASVLETVARNNDLGHPLCNNLRQGPWAANYVTDRLDHYIKRFPKLVKLRDWLKERMSLMKTIPVSYVPKYFAIIILSAWQACRVRAFAIMPPVLTSKPYKASSLHTFTKALSLGAIQMNGTVSSTGLFPAPYPSFEKGPYASLAAGLPHFSTNHMRCWGRDIFIALRGLFLLPGHFDAARAHIIAFGSTLRHGLIPNLLDSGRRPRYNARDAVWWWLWGVQQYCSMAPEGVEFLKTVVYRRFPPKNQYKNPAPNTEEEIDDDGDSFIEPVDPRTYKYKSTIADLIQEILERHAHGIHFREWNAGPNLDHAMRDEGFNMTINTCLVMETIIEDAGTRIIVKRVGTGFVKGGNRWNCGTWMDKMGDSVKAGTKGVPASPRDGSPIEIIGLLKACVRWLSEITAKKDQTIFPYKGVVVKDGTTSSRDKLITYSEWNQMIQESFEKYFWIPQGR